MKDRLRLVRKDLKLTQADMGQALGCSQTAYAKYESGMVIPDKPMRMLICEKFNVNPEWLETGEGEPYNDAVTPTLKLLKAEYKLDDLDVQIIEKYLELSPIERQVFKDYVKKIKDTE